MVVDDRLRNARFLGKPAERQGFRSFLPDQAPGNVQQLPVPLVARQALARPGFRDLLSCIGS